VKLTRREFFKLTGVAALAAAVVGCDWESEPAFSDRLEDAKEVTTICPYCSCGCGAICYVAGGKLVSVSGDPDHPINEGALCSKGASLLNLNTVYNLRTHAPELNPNRLTKVLYRAPYSTEWVEKNWRWALDRIAKRVKETRDESFESQAGGITVNRTLAIAHLGSAALDNEENYLLAKLMRSLGIVNLDHHARL
jgi:formate dehydrogenase major subunit